MGLFNWALKGVKVEKRPAKKKKDGSGVNLPDELNQILAQNPAQPELASSAQTVAEFPLGTGQPSTESAQRAASILFDHTENSNQTGFGYEYNNDNNNAQYSAPQNFSPQPNFTNALNGSTYGNRNILVVTPRTTAEVSQVVANIQNGDACIICLEGLDVADAQRRLDFLSGVVCSMHGSIKKLNPNTYILTPSGIGVRD